MGQTVQLNRFLQAKQSTQVQITKSLCINGDNSIGDITRASKGLDPDHARHFMEPELGPNRSAESFFASKTINLLFAIEASLTLQQIEKSRRFFVAIGVLMVITNHQSMHLVVGRRYISTLKEFRQI